MFLSRATIQHVNSIAHEGEVLVFATDIAGKFHYTIKQDGFENSYGSIEVRGWEKWQGLEFPQEPDDLSVINQQHEELT